MYFLLPHGFRKIHAHRYPMDFKRNIPHVSPQISVNVLSQLSMNSLQISNGMRPCPHEFMWIPRLCALGIPVDFHRAKPMDSQQIFHGYVPLESLWISKGQSPWTPNRFSTGIWICPWISYGFPRLCAHRFQEISQVTQSSC